MKNIHGLIVSDKGLVLLARVLKEARLKDGRKIFIKPHWKGPLRDSKNKIGIETRERVIPIEEKNED